MFKKVRILIKSKKMINKINLIIFVNYNFFMKIGIVCYPTYGGSGVVATELGMGLANKGHLVHFITYRQPARLTQFHENIFYHEVSAE